MQKPKYKVGDTLRIVHPNISGTIVVVKIEPAFEYDPEDYRFWYYYSSDSEASWSENYLRPITKLDKALK